MSLYGDYIKETLGKEIIESNCGFATFYPLNDGMYIEDIFVVPEHRKSNVASEFANAITVVAKDRGFNKLYGSVRPSSKTSTESMKVLLAYGFKIDSSVNDGIILSKEL